MRVAAVLLMRVSGRRYQKSDLAARARRVQPIRRALLREKCDSRKTSISAVSNGEKLNCVSCAAGVNMNDRVFFSPHVVNERSQ